jgi:exo-beta-1,3-glucanase (GH17 family)
MVRRLFGRSVLACLILSWPAFGEALSYRFAATSQGYLATGLEGYGAFSRHDIQFLVRYGGARGGRGINVTVVHERTADILDFRNFDVWSSGQAAAVEMIAFLSALPAGRVVLLAIGDEGGLMNAGVCSPRGSWVEDVYVALEALGSQHIREVCFRQAWAMVSTKGLLPARAEAFGVGPKTASASIRFANVAAIKGVDYAPFRIGQAPWGPCPSLADIQADMPRLKSMATHVRTYGLVGCDIGQKILTASNAAGVRTTVGLWLGRDLAANEAEIAKLAALFKQGLLKRTDVIVVGSEVILRDDLPVAELIAYINRVRAIVAPKAIPVATAEIWPIWLDDRGRALAAAVDRIFINALPYWEGRPVASAAASVRDEYARVWSTYPFKRVAISETGWPTGGAVVGAAVPSVANQKSFLTAFLCEAKNKQLPYYVVEAFDQQWKSIEEGEVGAHWGFYSAERLPKQPFLSLKVCPN